MIHLRFYMLLIMSSFFTSFTKNLTGFKLPDQYGGINPMTEKLKNGTTRDSNSCSTYVYSNTSSQNITPPESSSGVYYYKATPIHL